MAPLSHDLAGVVLPHDHLNGAGDTVDEKMEVDNFAHAGKVLAEIWSGTVIDGHPTIAEYIEPRDHDEPIIKDQAWRTAHVRESQYMLQIVKCADRTCCDEPRSSYFCVVRNRFIPPPLPLLQTDDGLVCRPDEVNSRFPSLFVQLILDSDVLSPGAMKRHAKHVPYDFACPSLHGELQKRTCDKCGLYHASIKSNKSHQRQRTGAAAANAPANATTNAPANAPANAPRIRPQRVAARRQRELMCVIAGEYEWLDDDEVDLRDIPRNIPQAIAEPGTPLLPPDAREPAWQDDVWRVVLASDIVYNYNYALFCSDYK